MANVTFPRKEFEKHIKITPEIEEKISLFGTPLEFLTEKEIEIEIFPDRPDLLSLQGYLRAFKAFLGKSPGLKTYKLYPPGKNYKVTIDPSVKKVRPFTACAIVKNLQFNEEKIKEIIDIQEKLHSTIGRNRKKAAIGIYPLEKIKLPIKYLAESPEKIKFIPLESDKELTGSQILTKLPTGREYAHLLEDLDKFPVFRDANKKVLSMPPIINSEETGKITSNTKQVFIECSGHDLQTLEKILNIIVTTLSDISPEVSVYQMNLEYDKKIKTPNLEPLKMKISLENTNKLLGLNLKDSDLSSLLPKMGYNYINKTVQIPAWRTDILHEVDIIEDIAIAYGYENFVPKIPDIATVGSESPQEKIKSKLSEILIGLNLLELSSYHLIKQDEAKLSKLQNPIELEDSKTDYKILRPNLLIPALRILTQNKDATFPQKFFEIGTVFSKYQGEETGIKESENLIIAISPGNFTEIKQILDYLSSTLNINLEIQEATKKPLIEGRTAEIQFQNKPIDNFKGGGHRGNLGSPIGYLGELHPETLRSWQIKMPVAVLELSLDEIFNLLNN